MLSASVEVIILVAVGRLRADLECIPTVLAGVGEDLELAANDLRVGQPSGKVVAWRSCGPARQHRGGEEVVRLQG